VIRAARPARFGAKTLARASVFLFGAITLEARHLARFQRREAITLEARHLARFQRRKAITLEARHLARFQRREKMSEV
jgi:hypothetical protein